MLKDTANLFNDLIQPKNRNLLTTKKGSNKNQGVAVKSLIVVQAVQIIVATVMPENGCQVRHIKKLDIDNAF